MSMFLRLRRPTPPHKTYFVHCEPHDTIDRLLGEVARVEGLPTTEHLQLYHRQCLISGDRSATLQQLQLDNCSMCYVCVLGQDGKYEEIPPLQPTPPRGGPQQHAAMAH